MYETAIFIVIGFVVFLIARRLAISYLLRQMSKKTFEQEYFTILRAPQFKVKGKYE